MFGQTGDYSAAPRGGIIVWAAPIALNEVFLAIWLIVRGLNPSAVAGRSDKTDIDQIESRA